MNSGLDKQKGRLFSPTLPQWPKYSITGTTTMKMLKLTTSTLFIYLMVMQQSMATDHPKNVCLTDPSLPGCTLPAFPGVPEINAAGAIIAIGLVIGLSALIREKFLRQ
ncbi:MAG: hypothetical protein ACI9LO_003276 [Planctomycetota bacterium]|jgi:hypothetical protein